jgi:outer membrane biosynthesis protein TonB
MQPTRTRHSKSGNLFGQRGRVLAADAQPLDAMIQVLLVLFLQISAPAAKPADGPSVVFAPNAWKDPPGNQNFPSCDAAHPDAVAAGSPGTKAPTILPSKSPTITERGRIIAELYIDQAGRIRDIRVLRASGKVFVEESIKQLKTTRFQPGTANGKPIPMCVAVNRWSEVR